MFKKILSCIISSILISKEIVAISNNSNELIIKEHKDILKIEDEDKKIISNSKIKKNIVKNTTCISLIFTFPFILYFGIIYTCRHFKRTSAEEYEYLADVTKNNLKYNWVECRFENDNTIDDNIIQAKLSKNYYECSCLEYEKRYCQYSNDTGSVKIKDMV